MAGPRIWPESGRLNPLLAAALARKAKGEFERAVALDPIESCRRGTICRSYYTEAPAIMGGGLDKAREQASQVGKHDAAKAHPILARVAVKEKRYGDAEAQFQQAIKEANNPADYWLQLAEFYRLCGRSHDMQKAVGSAIGQSNKPAETYFDAASQLYLGGRDFPDAVQYLQSYLASGELVESAPTFRAHYLLGQIYERMGRTRPQLRNTRHHSLWRPASSRPTGPWESCVSRMSSDRFR